MTRKNIPKKNLTFQNDFYETIIDIYNAGGCENVREYIDNNNDIDSTEYNEALKAMLDDDNTDELFELMITHEKFKHTEIIDEFMLCCDISYKLLYGDKNKFKFNLIWKIKESNFYKMEVELKQYQEEMKSEFDPSKSYYTYDLDYCPPINELTFSQLKLNELDPYYPVLSERGQEICSKGMAIEKNLMKYIQIGSYFGYTNGTIKLLEYQSTFFEFEVDFSNLFYKFYEYNTDRYGILNYILKNENTKKVVTKNFRQFVSSFILEESLSKNIIVLDIISKNVSEEQFKFFLEHLIRRSVYSNGRYSNGSMESLNNIFELVKYIHDLYCDKIKISFNINDESHRYKYQIYDQMIFNGYEFLSTFSFIFYKDLFFPKGDLINHIIYKNNFYKRKINQDDLNRNDIEFFIKYTETLNQLVSNIGTIKKDIDSTQQKFLKDLIEDTKKIYHELIENYPHRMI